MNTYNLRDVFTPSQPAAEINYIERPSISRRFDRAIETKGKQLIIYGSSGVGKTSLLKNKIEKLNLKVLTTHCISSMTFEDILKQAFNELEVFIENQRSTYIDSEISSQGTIGGSFIPINVGLSSNTKTNNTNNFDRAIEYQITPQSLVKILGEQEIIWILEDFHKIDNQEKKHLVQVMKLFMDKSTLYPSTKIIAIGAVNTAREILQFDPEMKNRISEIEVPLMSSEELGNIILRGENLLKISILENIKEKVIVYSSGLPSVTHHLCYLMCDELKIKKTNANIKKLEIHFPTLEKAIDEYLQEYSDTFKAIFEQAIKIKRNRKFDNPIEIFRGILAHKKETFCVKDVLSKIQLLHSEYKGNNLEKYIYELTTSEKGEILRHLEDSDTYHFANPFIKAYFQCALNNDSGFKKLTTKVKIIDLKDRLDLEYQLLQKTYSDFHSPLTENPFDDEIYYS